jgi:hypothetical protein
MRANRGLVRRAGGWFFAFLQRRILLPDIEDSQCPLKAFRHSAAQRIFRLQQIDRWSFDAEVLYIARRLGLKVQTVPVRWSAVAGSHLRLWPAIKSTLRLVRIRMAHSGVNARTLAEEAPEAA